MQPATRVQPHRRAVLAGNRRAADSVEHRRGVRDLDHRDDADTAMLAKAAQDEEYRPYRGRAEQADKREKRLANLRFEFEDEALRKLVTQEIKESPWNCDNPCVALELGREGDRVEVAIVEASAYWTRTFDLAEETPIDNESEAVLLSPEVAIAVENPEETGRYDANSEVEIREFRGRQIYVDGKPIGDPFE